MQTQIQIIMEIKSIITTDKVHHFVYSYAITKALRTFLPWYYAAGIALLIGIAKEVYDKVSGKGCTEWKDFIADAAGIAAGCVL